MNYKYESMLDHLFDRFCMVTKFILPSIGDLKFSTLNYDNTCAYLDNRIMHDSESKKHMLDQHFEGKLNHLYFITKD